jgi:hypothetical protein
VTFPIKPIRIGERKTLLSTDGDDRVRLWILDGEYPEPGIKDLIEATPLASISMDRAEFVTWLQETLNLYVKPV